MGNLISQGQNGLNTDGIVIPASTFDNTDMLINMLGKLLETNNTELIFKVVDDYNKKINDQLSKGDISQENANRRRINLDISKPSQMIKDFHNKLVLSANPQSSIASLPNAASRSAELERAGYDFKDAGRTMAALGKYVSKDLDPIKATIESTVLDSDVKKVAGTVLNKFKDMKTQNLFFEYKFVQLYVFMSVFIQHVYQTMQDFIVKVEEINEAKNRVRINAYKKLFDELLKIFEVKGVDVGNPEDLDKMFANLAGSIQQKVKDDQELFKKAASASMKDLLKFILENENGMTTDLISAVKDIESKQKTQSTVPSTFSPYAANNL